MKTVALLLDDRENAYQRMLVREAHLAAEELGVRLLEPGFASGSSWNQVTELNAHLRSETPPNAIATLLLGAHLTRRQFERAAKAGISIVMLNRVPPWLTDLQEEYPDVLVTAVTPRQSVVGQIQGEQAIRLAAPKALVILITGTADSTSAIDRREGFFDHIEDRFDVRELDGGWTFAGAEQALTKWFRLWPDRAPELIVCHNDAMAQGARAAIAKETARRGAPALMRIAILGCDGLPEEGQTWVARQEQTATVVLPTTTRVAIEALARFWKTGERADVVELDATSYPAIEEIRRVAGAGGGT